MTKKTRWTKHSKLMNGGVTEGYARLTPTEDEGVSLYQEDRVLRMRFSSEAEMQTWADRYGVRVRPDGTSFWLDFNADTFNLYSVGLAWQRQYMAV
jgi:hypothetical protein